MDRQNAGLVNGLIVTDSESEDAEMWTKAETVEAEKRKLVEKQIVIMRQKLRRQRAKSVPDARFKVSKKRERNHGEIPKYWERQKSLQQNGLLEQTIGIEWTFDGNCNVKEKVTYNRIRKHLQELYGYHFLMALSYSCVWPGIRGGKVPKKYRGLTKVTTRRANKGFTLKFNPDNHWSAAFIVG